MAAVEQETYGNKLAPHVVYTQLSAKFNKTNQIWIFVFFDLLSLFLSNNTSLRM